MDIDIDPFIQIDLVVIIEEFILAFGLSIALKTSVIVPFVIFKEMLCADAAIVYGWQKVKHKPKSNDFSGFCN